MRISLLLACLVTCSISTVYGGDRSPGNHPQHVGPYPPAARTPELAPTSLVPSEQLPLLVLAASSQKNEPAAMTHNVRALLSCTLHNPGEYPPADRPGVRRPLYRRCECPNIAIPRPAQNHTKSGDHASRTARLYPRRLQTHRAYETPR